MKILTDKGLSERFLIKFCLRLKYYAKMGGGQNKQSPSGAGTGPGTVLIRTPESILVSRMPQYILSTPVPKAG